MTLQQALHTIEENGHASSGLPAKDANQKKLKQAAWCAILDYMVANNVFAGNETWQAHYTTYQEKGITPISEDFKALHSKLLNPKPSKIIPAPLELLLLFKALDKAFHYPSPSDNQKVVYVDMDNVIVDFPSAFAHYDAEMLTKYEHNRDEISGIFGRMEPMDGAIEALELLFRHFDVYLLSTAPWNNPSSWSDKLLWVQKWLPVVGYKRLILSHNKQLNAGDYLIDDRTKNGVLKFKGEHIHFGTAAFPDWKTTTDYILQEQITPTVRLSPIEKHDTTVLYIGGMHGSSESSTLKAIREACPDTPISYLDYTREIPDKAAYELNNSIEYHLRDNAKVILVGNSLGGYWANFFSEKFRLPVVLINPSFEPQKNLLKYEQLDHRLLKQYTQSRFDFKNKVAILGRRDEVVDNTLNESLLKDAKSIIWVDEAHRISNHAPVVEEVQKMLVAQKFANMPVAEKGTTILMQQPDTVGKFDVTFEHWVYKGISCVSVAFVKSEIERYSDAEISAYVCQECNSESATVGRSAEGYIIVTYSCLAVT